MTISDNFEGVSSVKGPKTAQNTSIIKNIKIWVDKENADPFSDLKKILSELGLEKSNLAVEYEAYGLTGRNAIKLNNNLKNTR